MMGRTHALTGWCAGLAISPLLGADTLVEAVVVSSTTAGYALLPDLDHPGARASRLLGPFTKGISWLLRRSSGALYQVTKGPRDERGKGTHRHLSHTVLFAAALGGLTALATQLGGGYAVAVVVLFGLLLAEDALGDWLLPIAVGATVWWISQAGPDVLSGLEAMSGWLGIAVAVGCFTHCLGDALTKSGCPFLFPLPIAGETWYEIRPPKWLRFSTGKKVETRLVFPAFAVLAVLLLPGVWDALITAVTSVLAPSNTGVSAP